MAVVRAEDVARASALNGMFHALRSSDVPIGLAILHSTSDGNTSVENYPCHVVFTGFGAKGMDLPRDELTPAVVLMVTDPIPARHYGFCLDVFVDNMESTWQGPICWQWVDVVLTAIQDLVNLGCQPRPRGIGVSAGGHKLIAALARMQTVHYSFQFSMAVFIGAALHPESHETGLATILSHQVLVIVHHHAHDTLSLWVRWDASGSKPQPRLEASFTSVCSTKNSHTFSATTFTVAQASCSDRKLSGTTCGTRLM